MTIQSRAGTLNAKELVEGKARFIIPVTANGNFGVFYNPRMNLNRDIAILFASSHFPPFRHLRVCDPMTASGVRAARYALESPEVMSVVASDNELQTIEATEKTIRVNNLIGKVSVVQSDANVLLLSHTKDRFDLIDLDPFGSPAPFFENALRATLDCGVVAATATDMGPLSGARAAACVRKYGIKPIRTEFEKEMAVRVLAASLAMTASKLQLGIEIVFAHASDHYARIYAEVTKGRTAANLTWESLGYVEYCSNCLRRNVRRALNSIRTTCEDCQHHTSIGGPIWLGSIWNKRTLQAMIEHTPMLQSDRLSEVQNMLAMASEEVDAPAFHYRTDAFARKLSHGPPSMKRLLGALVQSGYQATGTHFHPNGFRTNASSTEIARIIRALSDMI